MKKTRVLIVEDSAVIRQFLVHIISHDPRLEIAGAVGSAEEALEILDRVAPDVISMDIRLPGINGFEATQQIMEKRPTPVVIVSASVDPSDSRTTMEALSAGALAAVEKPPGVTSMDHEMLADRLCTQLAIMSQVKVIRRHAAVRPAPFVVRRPAARPRYSVLGVVGSTGAPRALPLLLNALGADFPLPILMVQHITASFLEPFAAWLEGICPFPVEIVHGQLAVSSGRIYLAAADHHLRALQGGVGVDRSDPVCAQRPSGTTLFQSMGDIYGARAVGVLLTGMGEDGAEGMLHLRSRGGYTVAEDASTAVVYGMPAAAVRLGAVSESLPLHAIAPRLLELVQSRSEVA